VRQYCELVFDDFVVGTTTVYSNPRFEELLATSDRYAIQAVVDQVSGTSPTLTLQIEHGSDGLNWSAKAGIPEINLRGLSSTSTNVFTGFDDGSNPTHARMRIRITLGGTSPQANVKVYVTGRERLPG
jgi:hypothetical protein